MLPEIRLCGLFNGKSSETSRRFPKIHVLNYTSYVKFFEKNYITNLY